MKRLLVDSSYLVAHFNPDDAHHDATGAIEDRFMSGHWEELLLVDGVFAETVTVLMARRSFKLAKEVGELLRNGKEIHWVHMGDHLEEAWHQYLVQGDAGRSFVDCALVAVAHAYGIQQIASFDTGFDGVVGMKRVP